MDKTELAINEVYVETESDDIFSRLINDYSTKTYDVVSFGLIILDYTNTYSLYYVFIQPEIVFEDVIRLVSATDEQGENAKESSRVDYIAEQNAILIDTWVINKETIDRRLKAFNTNVKKIAQMDASTKKALEKDPTSYGGTVTLTDSEINFTLTYPEIDAGHIKEIIDKIYNDFR